MKIETKTKSSNGHKAQLKLDLAKRDGKLSTDKNGSSSWWLPEEFRVLCAWCGIEMQTPKVLRDTPAPESHGICKCCAANMGMPLELISQSFV